MTFEELVRRTIPAEPWAEGDNIPWNDPSFSERMLAEHLSQQHDLASRRCETIDRQVNWIHDEILAKCPTRILDLTCGPGLYTSRLVRLGHTCHGIDFAPAAIRHATQEARERKLACTYVQADVRTADFGTDHGLVMMLFGQINVFRPAEARGILQRAFAALRPGGRLLLEPQLLSTVEQSGRAPSTWQTIGPTGGLFSAHPHLLLLEAFWAADRAVATQRFFVVDSATHEITRYAMSTQGYTEEEWGDLLRTTGFRDLRFFPSLVGEPVTANHQGTNFVVTAAK